MSAQSKQLFPTGFTNYLSMFHNSHTYISMYLFACARKLIWLLIWSIMINYSYRFLQAFYVYKRGCYLIELISPYRYKIRIYDFEVLLRWPFMALDAASIYLLMVDMKSLRRIIRLNLESVLRAKNLPAE